MVSRVGPNAKVKQVIMATTAVGVPVSTNVPRIYLPLVSFRLESCQNRRGDTKTVPTTDAIRAKLERM